MRRRGPETPPNRLTATTCTVAAPRFLLPSTRSAAGFRAARGLLRGERASGRPEPGGHMAAKKTGARRYGKKAAKKISRVMHEWKEGTLRSGRSGKKVTSRKQAVAIGISEA